MNLKPGVLRASPKASPQTSPMIESGSYNGSSNPTPNRINGLGGYELEGLTADERAQLTTQFWAKVKKTDSCWLWTGNAVGGNGMRHGQAVLPRNANPQRHIYAHRLAWQLEYGSIPDGLQVCHVCDVPLCVRAAGHLFLGTQADNLKDAARKGRLSVSRRGKLTLADRLAIYHMPDRRGVVVELAIRYRVSKTCITLTRQGRFSGSPLRPIQMSHAHV